MTEEWWISLGLFPRLFWAWCNVPLARHPKFRFNPDKGWVIEGFFGLTLGCFADEEKAATAWMILALFQYGKCKDG